MFLTIFLTTIQGASWSLFCLIVSLVLLFIAAFVTGSAGAADAPFYRRFGFGWAGLFFFVLSVAIG
jgi:hypothetical protein